MTVLCSSDARETEAMVRAAYDYKGPVYMRISRIGVPDYHKPDYVFKIGKGEILREGKAAAIVATGIMVTEAIEAAQLLAMEGIEVTVINMPSIKPIDKELLVRVAKETGGIVTAEEHNVVGGLGSAVAEVLAQDTTVPMRFVGIQDKFGCSGKPETLLEEYHLKAQDIVRAVKEIAKTAK
jgi:transketolase